MWYYPQVTAIRGNMAKRTPNGVLDVADPAQVNIAIDIYRKTGSITCAAGESGLHRQTVYKYLKKNGIETPRKAIEEARAKRPVRVCYFTDAHDRIDWDKSRFEWLGKHVKKTKPDYLVCGGDIFDVDSLNKHVRNESFEGKLKPGFEAELASLAEALRAIDKYLPSNIEKHITLGNHEYRIHRYENENPEVYGILSAAFYGLLEQHNWIVTPFKQYLNIYGVEFTHVPINAMGREMGGKTAATRIATDSVCDVVYGHTHNRHDASVAKLGPDNRHTRAYNGGCFMPNGARMDYAKASQNHWEYGLTDMAIYNGRIEATSWVSMAQLERDHV